MIRSIFFVLFLYLKNHDTHGSRSFPATLNRRRGSSSPLKGSEGLWDGGNEGGDASSDDEVESDSEVELENGSSSEILPQSQSQQLLGVVDVLSSSPVVQHGENEDGDKYSLLRPDKEINDLNSSKNQRSSDDQHRLLQQEEEAANNQDVADKKSIPRSNKNQNHKEHKNQNELTSSSLLPQPTNQPQTQSQREKYAKRKPRRSASPASSSPASSSPASSSQPLQTLEKIQQMLEETDYKMVSNPNNTPQKYNQNHHQQNTHYFEESIESSSQALPSANHRRIESEENEGEEYPFSDNDDGLGYPLPNLPVYYSDAEAGDYSDNDAPSVFSSSPPPPSSLSSNSAQPRRDSLEQNPVNFYNRQNVDYMLPDNKSQIQQPLLPQQQNQQQEQGYQQGQQQNQQQQQKEPLQSTLKKDPMYDSNNSNYINQLSPQPSTTNSLPVQDIGNQASLYPPYQNMYQNSYNTMYPYSAYPYYSPYNTPLTGNFAQPFNTNQNHQYQQQQQHQQRQQHSLALQKEQQEQQHEQFSASEATPVSRSTKSPQILSARTQPLPYTQQQSQLHGNLENDKTNDSSSPATSTNFAKRKETETFEGSSNNAEVGAASNARSSARANKMFGFFGSSTRQQSYDGNLEKAQQQRNKSQKPMMKYPPQPSPKITSTMHPPHMQAQIPPPYPLTLHPIATKNPALFSSGLIESDAVPATTNIIEKGTSTKMTRIKLNSESIQKILTLIVVVSAMSYAAVSPQSLSSIEYNHLFYDNLKLVLYATIGPTLYFLCVWSGKENNINSITQTFYQSFIGLYLLTYVMEIIFTTFVRLGVFYFLENQIFGALTNEGKQIPLITIPWVLKEHFYKPKWMTLFVSDFITSCVVCPVVEEFMKLKMLQWSVQLPKNFRWVKMSSKSKSTLDVTNESSNKNNSNQKIERKKKRKGEKLYSAERIITSNSDNIVSAPISQAPNLAHPCTNINQYVTQMLVVSIGMKLADSIRRVLMYTKRYNTNKRFYAIVRGIFPIQELCGTMTALALAKRDVLGIKQYRSYKSILLPSILLHAIANYRGMKPIFKWISSSPWLEVQISPLTIENDHSTFPQLVGKVCRQFLWFLILGRVLNSCIKNYYWINRNASLAAAATITGDITRKEKGQLQQTYASAESDAIISTTNTTSAARNYSASPSLAAAHYQGQRNKGDVSHKTESARNNVENTNN